MKNGKRKKVGKTGYKGSCHGPERQERRLLGLREVMVGPPLIIKGLFKMVLCSQLLVFDIPKL